MAEDERTTEGRQGQVRAARPEDAAQDAAAAARQRQLERDTAEIRESARRVEATTPDAVRERTVHDITREIEASTSRSRDGA